MKPIICLMLSSLLMGGTSLAADRPADGTPGQKHAKHQRARDSAPNDDRDATGRSVSFSVREVRVIREYYAPRYRALPPGLQKKLRRTGQLPPGWQKKLEPFPVVVERQLVMLPTGYQRGVIDGHAVIYNPRTQVIIDVAVLF